MSLPSFAGKNAIVTGAARGIGAAIALALAENGCNVLFNYVSDGSKGKADELVQQIEKMGRKGFAVQLELATPDVGDKFLAAAKNAFGDHFKLHFLIHNAGVSVNASLQEITVENFDKQYNVNVRAPVFITKALQPYMAKHDNGRIVILSSVSARMGAATKGVYSASKISISNFAYTWTNEFGKEDGITINAIEPGPVVTDMWEANLDEFKATFDQRLVASTKEISDLILMICSPLSRWCSGGVLNANCGLFNPV